MVSAAAGAPTASALGFAYRRLRRGFGSGELRVLAAALAVAAAAAIAVGLFTDRVRQAVESGAGDQLGADAVIRSSDDLPAELVEQVQALGLRTTRVTQFPSVVAPVNSDQTQLATIKAVEAGYPLRGQLTLAREPFGATETAPPQPARGEVWVDLRLWSALTLHPDAALQVGASTLKVTHVISDEPGRGGAFAELAPQLLMNADDLPATALLGPGSRFQVTLLLAGTRAQLTAARAIKLEPELRFVSPEDDRPEIKRSLQRARSFLNIAVLATILLAAAAVALSARQHSTRLRDEVALLKVLGARRAFIRRTLVLQILLLGLFAGGIGAVAGALGQQVLASLAGPLLHISLPAPGWLPLPAVLALVLLLLAGFALPPVLASVDSAPARVFQRAADTQAGSWWGLAAATLAIAALLWLEAGELKLAGFVLLGAGGTAAVLAGCAWLLVRWLSRLRTRAGVAWRFGLGNIARRRGAAIAQIVALGVALLALLLVTVVREDLLASWRDKLPPKTPNQFLINIQPQQTDALRAFFAERGYPDLPLVPMARARLTALNGKEVTADSFEDQETRRWINREFNLSWTDQFHDDNQFVEGKAWGEEARGKTWVSVDRYGVERLKLKLGDTMTLDFAGHVKTLEVHSIRDVKWDSFRPNFFLVTPPGVLDAPGFGAPVQWLSSFYLPDAQGPAARMLLRDLVRTFPNVTAVDLDAALNQVRGIVDRIVNALEFIFLFALIAGLIVMLAVIEGSKPERMRETGVLRALGASSRTITQGLIAEFAVLGLLAGLIAAFAAQALAWVLAVQVFELPYGPRPLLWLVGAVAGGVIVTAAGWLSLRSVLKTPPRIVLASGG
jgi:putative ABC transport system permease protein